MAKPNKNEMVDTPEFLLLLKQWAEVRTQAATLAKQESELRDKVYEMAFPKVVADQNAVGTFNVNLPNNWLLKTVAKFNVTVDAPLLQTMKKELIDRLGIPVDSIFKYKPELSLTEYNKQSDVVKTELSSIVTFKRAKPTIELVPPKTENISPE